MMSDIWNPKQNCIGPRLDSGFGHKSLGLTVALKTLELVTARPGEEAFGLKME